MFGIDLSAVHLSLYLCGPVCNMIPLLLLSSTQCQTKHLTIQQKTSRSQASNSDLFKMHVKNNLTNATSQAYWPHSLTITNTIKFPCKDNLCHNNLPLLQSARSVIAVIIKRNVLQNYCKLIFFLWLVRRATLALNVLPRNFSDCCQGCSMTQHHRRLQHLNLFYTSSSAAFL